MLSRQEVLSLVMTASSGFTVYTMINKVFTMITGGVIMVNANYRLCWPPAGEGCHPGHSA